MSTTIEIWERGKKRGARFMKKVLKCRGKNLKQIQKFLTVIGVVVAVKFVAKPLARGGEFIATQKT